MTTELKPCSALLRDFEAHHAKLAEQNDTGAATQQSPPLIAAESPLLELLINDLSRVVPQQLRDQLWQAKSLRAALDWVGAAAMYRWISEDRIAAQAFQDSLQTDPRRGCLALEVVSILFRQ